MAKDKFHQAIFLVPIILMVLKTCLAHNCKNGSEETTKITAANNIFKVNQKYEKYSNGRDYQLDMKLPRSRSNAGDKDGEGATRDRSRLWPEGIVPYLIGYNLMRHKDHVKAIEAAMQEWEQQTCIKFKKLEREANYVEIEDGDGCSSEVGMEGGRQSISLGRGCYSHGTILHELGHLLGFYHEQNRPDRDDYVEILEDNIQERFKYAFAKYQWHKIDSRSVPYDYESIMHYGANDFSIDKFRLPTIRSLDPRVKDFGNNHLSPLDIKQINLMYNCSEKNPKFPEDFTWSNNGRTIDGECVRIFEPREHRKTGWADNFLCQHKGKKNIGFRWSPNGPLDNMRCTKISLPSKPARLTWTDNYLCVPHESVFKLYWSTNGPLVNKSCLKITEPRDRVWIRANPYLCAEVASIDGVWSQWDPWDKCNRECGGGIQSRRRTCTNPPPSNGGRYCAGDSSETRICNSDPCSAWPHFPGDFTFGYFTYPPLDKYCIRMYERFHFMGSDPYFCSDGSMRDLDMRWSDRGAFSGMRCTQILKPGRFSWDDNYLCIDQDAPYRFKWSYQGSIHGLPCMKFEADKLDGWKSKNHYLCLENPQVKNGSASERHRRVNGRWSPWKPWSPCSLSCNTGWQSRVRTCSNPAPRNGGKDCTGPKSEVRLCNKKPCPAVCGGKETGSNGIIKSPSYPASYPHGSSCKWTITVARGQVVKLTFNAFRLYRGRRGCDADRVTVKDGASVRAKTLGTFCGALSLPKLLFSTANTMTVEFLSDAQNNDVGFRASWKAETVSGDVQASKPDTGCGGDLRGNNGTFKGLVPPRKRSCNWFIIADKGRFLTVIYEVFDVTKQARSRRCRANYVELREYFDNRRVSHGRQCGPKKDVRTVFRLKTNVARIRMRSDIKNRGRGITVRWSSHAQESLAANRKG